MNSDVLHRVREALPRASAAERRVALAIIADPMQVLDMTITELAHSCGTSQASVARFCQTLGYTGYRQLRVQVATATGRERAELDRFELDDDEINPTDSLEDVVAKIAYQEARAIEQTAKAVGLTALSAAVEAIGTASRIDIYGFASSGLTAQDLQQKLHRIGLFAHCWSDIHLALQSAALLTPPAVAIGISHSGTTLETNNALAVAHKTGATTIALTNYPESTLAKQADLVLTTRARESRYRAGAMSSRIAQLALVDFLFVRVAQGRYDDVTESLRLTYEAVQDHRLTNPAS